MPSSTVEDYLKQIYLEGQRSGGGLVAMGRLATAMEVVPGTATSMVKTLESSGLVHYAPRTGVRLTKGGEQLALHVLRRHRLIELFLVRILGLDWSQVHSEAEELEHAVSEKVLARIDDLLGHPRTDPHGDPIPTATGKLSPLSELSLLGCPLNSPLCVSRVTDQDPAFLQFAERHGLTPGTPLTVLSRDDLAGAISLSTGAHPPLTLGQTAAGKIWVALASPPPEPAGKPAAARHQNRRRKVSSNQ